MDCNFAIYCDTERATTIKIHRKECKFIKSHEGHDHEWFWAPTYANARIIVELLEKDRRLGSTDCVHCGPKPSQGDSALSINDDEIDPELEKQMKRSKGSGGGGGNNSRNIANSEYAKDYRN